RIAPGAPPARPQERVGFHPSPRPAMRGLRAGNTWVIELHNPDDLAERAARIELLLLDVDGVLTDGLIVYTDAGAELKRFHVRDGSGLKFWQLAGKRAAIVSGRNSPAVTRRAAELGVAPVLQGHADKLAAFEEVLAETGLRPEQVCAVGDDLPDLPVL